ncbi:hypothetical protein [Bacillus sp. JCM 19041]|uniref:hypothetical protein n=1 Tax=Bacillus sp. JCM 19041 TaxID=1460637 RepID=UPI0006D2C4B6
MAAIVIHYDRHFTHSTVRFFMDEFNGRSDDIVHKGKEAFSQQLAKGIHPFIVLFVSLGWFTGILNGTELLNLIQDPLLTFQDVPVVLLLGIPLSFYALAMVGIHPIASMVLVHEVVGPILAPTMSLALTIMYIVSALATFTISLMALSSQ